MSPPTPPYPTRFGWPMRLFLALILFDMIFRSFSVLIDWGEWADELNMSRRPANRLPTRDELAELRDQASPDNPAPMRDAYFRAADALADFYRPWPDPDARRKVRTWQDWGKWSVVWLCSRLEVMENMVGFNQEWPMFSPNVGRRRFVARARLIYEDGEERIIRSKADPEDLTRYSHWFEEKILDHELKVREGKNYVDEAFGYCNLLRHRYATNARGSPLATIRLFKVRYDLPPPDVDARQWLAEQTGPPASQVYADFYLFDCKTNHGKSLLDRYP